MRTLCSRLSKIEAVNTGKDDIVMDTLQKQVGTLAGKVDDLCQLIEQLTTRVSDVVTECRFGADQAHRIESGISSGYSTYSNHGGLDGAFEHKDVLVDNNGLDTVGQSGEKTLTPEIQIQRLTAQLTAAYNRIAALEEQLLSQRTHY
ncbi:MAG TPA: hypothetical protein V6C46_04230 [Coleofasciculaceae cyanobacterium]